MKMKRIFSLLLIMSSLLLISCGHTSNNSSNQSVQERPNYINTSFELYADELNNGSLLFNKPYRIVGESSGNAYYNFTIVCNGKFKYILSSSCSPDDDLKSIIGGYAVFNKEQSKINIINEDKIKEYEK